MMVVSGAGVSIGLGVGGSGSVGGCNVRVSMMIYMNIIVCSGICH